MKNEAQSPAVHCKSVHWSSCPRVAFRGIDRPLEKNKTQAEWTETVTRMQKKALDKISDADVKAIVAYLNAVQGPKN